MAFAALWDRSVPLLDEIPEADGGAVALASLRAKKVMIFFRTVTTALQFISRLIGCYIICFGWMVLGVGVLTMAGGQDDSLPFIIAGFLLVPGWLLLRFADGLFPFSSKFYETLEEPLP
jgi:hypothetical protein